MGCRIHVVKKHAEYGSSEAFTWKSYEFHDLLSMLGAMPTECQGEGEFECEVGDYRLAKDRLQLYKFGGWEHVADALDGYEESDLTSKLDELGGLDNVLESMVAFWKEKDPDSNWISFVSF